MIFKCKICGGNLDVKQGERITVCEYCGVRQTIPTFIEPKIEEIYNRANNYLMNNEFDKAENLFNQILYNDKTNADAYWNILMCRYGVSYVKDPADGKYIPTCNRTLYSPIFNDENYKKAIQYADNAQKELYAADAKVIDQIQSGILAVSRKEKPFDIFISYKETYMNGIRTLDSIAAQDLYEKLTVEGYKVFFSRITLEDKAGTEYEPYIYAALASSKVMITVCSSKENIESVWVKNEWSRFLGFAQRDNSKTILPLYFDMDKSELPDEFAHLPSYDMKTEGFEQDLLRGIKKLIPLPIMEKERREKRRKILKKIGIGAAAVCVIAAACAVPWFMKLPDYNAAMQLYYDKNYPEATWAFDELGSYRNSKVMKDKCEKSWRKSLANTVCTGISNNECGAYYISPNGAIEHLSYDKRGKEESNLKINNHGKYVSIADGAFKSLYALHEDGYVENSSDNNEISENWNDIIQISPMLNCTSVALKSDGTMTFGRLTYKNEVNGYTFSDNWLETLKNWKNITSFDCFVDGIEGFCTDAIILGVQGNGRLCGVSFSSKFDDAKNCYIDVADSMYLDKILSNFSDVKTVRCCYEYPKIAITAITNHNTIQIYDDKFYEISAENLIDMIPKLDYRLLPRITRFYKLTDNGNVISDGDKVILKDIVKICDSATIARNGTIYLSDEKQPEKSIVFDEWIERMK